MLCSGICQVYMPVSDPGLQGQAVLAGLLYPAPRALQYNIDHIINIFVFIIFIYHP